MNDVLTDNAKSKILDLVGSSGKDGVVFRHHPSLGIDFKIVNRDKFDSVVISITPMVTTDFESLNYLQNFSLDFCYSTNDFIVKRIPCLQF